MIIISENFMRRVGESIDDFMIRLAENMNAYGLRWQDIADLLNAESGETYTESRWRKRCKTFNQGRMYERKRGGSDLLVAQARELEKQKISLAEQRVAINRAIREDARRDAILDEIRNGFATYTPISFNASCNRVAGEGGTLVVGLSDPHIGIWFSNPYGSYSLEIATARLEEYAVQVVEEARRHGTSHCVVALLGDLLSGVAHVQIRIENRENYIEQIKAASELISQFVAAIAPAFETVDLYGVSGNHSRAIQNDKDALVSECFDALIPWYVSARLQAHSNIIVHTDIDVAGITSLTIAGEEVCLVHGHLDALDEKSVARLNAKCGKMFKYVFCGHMHENEFRSVMETKVIRGGSLCGSGDEYTNRLRLSGSANQMMTVIKRDGKIGALIPIEF